jgi:hypothetical protein
MDGVIVAGAAVGAALGSLGYVVGRFLVFPVGRYRRLKAEIRRELDARAPEAPLSPASRERFQRLAVILAEQGGAELPVWYRQALRRRSEDPVAAVGLLQRLAGTSDPRTAERTSGRIRVVLGLPGGPEGANQQSVSAS